ncbi:hypothetical protein GQ600_12409 [Phytophthora cactorum]|nr:hypothetical protein GQ600_12409 [Phytophthora cactorum]
MSENLIYLITPRRSSNDVLAALNIASFIGFVGASGSKYVKYFKEISNNDNVNPISTLAAKYEDDALYKLIAQAERNAEMENHASYLQVEQTRYWIDKKNNPSEIFHLFQLDKMQSRKDIFSNPEFTAWVKYVDDLNTKYPDQPVSMTPTLAKLTTKTDPDPTPYPRCSHDVPQHEKGCVQFAGGYDFHIVELWKSPREVFKMLGVGNVFGNSALRNPLIKWWLNYAENFDNVTSNPQESWFQLLLDGMDGVASEKVIKKPKQSPATEETGQQWSVP